jgi:hypothetical protein
MGWSSNDDMLSELTAGKKWEQDWQKIPTGLGVVVPGRWYDLTMFPGSPPTFIHGNYISNYDFLAGTVGWTLSGGLVWTPATHLVTKSGGSVETLQQNTLGANGVTYTVVWTLGSYAGSGNVSVSLGGGTPVTRAANGTFTETITAGAGSNCPLLFSIASTISACTIDVVIMTRDLAFTPYTDTGIGGDLAIYTGGPVTPDTKHLLTKGCWTNVAACCPASLYIVDMLGVYPRIRTDLATQQDLTNALTLPRYPTGAGVRAFLSLTALNGANAQNIIQMSYTNPTPASGRGLGAVVSNTASGILGHILHSGVAAGNFGPFLPLGGGDPGVKSVENIRFSAASASAGFVSLVLCKPIARLPLTAAFFAAERDFLNQLPSAERIYDGACLGFIIGAGAIIPAASVYQGYLGVGWG